jgi:hypothetical protein
MAVIPNRLVRDLVSQFEPTTLRYRRLTPNYEKYWVPDSDAVNSIDRHEAMLWFRSQGDECLNCEGSSARLGFSMLPTAWRSSAADAFSCAWVHLSRLD